ncbi:MAG TPA: hypothetical protein ENJ56_04850 [Anaerolineae bacterium]|nr:hypothetical protein [Anaerolineae bacterium]
MRGLIRPISLIILFILTMGVLAACGVIGSGIQYGDDISKPFPKEAAGFVVCSEACSDQGQCGFTTSNDAEVSVVLVNPGRPVTRDHGAFVQANSAVTILDSREMQMTRQASGEKFPMNFYLIRYAPPSGTQVDGWVHGACVANRALK